MLAGFIPSAHFTTVIILVINFGLYAATVVYSMRANEGDAMNIGAGTLVDFGAKYVPYMRGGGQWWRLITAGFLHGGLIHILMNSWALFDLGASVEEFYGTGRMLVFYVVSTITGFYASSIWAPQTPSIGASAALCGLLGAMIALGMRDRSSIGDAMRGQYVRWLVFILIISLSGRVDMAAHVGGLAGGFGLAYLSGQPKHEGAPIEKLWRVAGAFAVLLTIGCFGLWFLWFMKPAV